MAPDFTGVEPCVSPMITACQMDCIVQPVEKLGEAAGEQILQRIETPDAPAFEQLLTSAYKPCGK